ncbi:MAG: cysteine--tRNA ligase [Candidatus Paceibacterota bacterium]
MKVYNTLTRQKEEFKPEGSKIRMFVCGPTVYDFAHIGHARTYVAFDVIVKYLRHKGYQVKYLQNITDIDDKIIERAKERGVEPSDLAKKFEKSYYEDMKSLGIDSVDKYARATDYISQIVKQIQTLVEKGFAYKIEGDGYYFDLSKFSDYGKLANRTGTEASDSVSRIDESVKKRNKGDFALWKFSKLGEPSWDTPLGKGRPGWHIEDTAITEKNFGQQYEVHCGAQDLIFPHHEAEIAQQESASDKKPFVEYWLHSGLLTVNGQKMSKSLDNFVTIREILKDYQPEALRMMVLMAHYRTPLDYSEDSIKHAEAAVNRIAEFMQRLKSAQSSLPKKTNLEIEELIEQIRKDFEKEMDDDFNTAKAIGHIFELIRKLNPLIDSRLLDKESCKKTIKMLVHLNKVLGVIPAKPTEIPGDVKKLAKERENARGEKDYSRADELRAEIQEMGYGIDDTPFGPLIKKSLK